MKAVVAEAVCEELEEKNDILDTEIVFYDEDVVIEATVPNEHAKHRVKADLHQYPMYVELEVQQ